MSYSPPHQNQTHHVRHTSLPTVYENNDPYRIIKKNPRIVDSLSDNDSDIGIVHSRSASDSSTSRLIHGQPPNYGFSDDPYANKKKWKALNKEDMRANSYLPYSHHQRDPNQKTEPMYIEEYSTPASTTLGMGSMLQDNLTDQINKGQTTEEPKRQQDIYDEKMVQLGSDMKKKKKRRFCGLRLRSLLLIVFLILAMIGIIVYFVWPRIPMMILEDVDNIGSDHWNPAEQSLSSDWRLNVTLDNSANWVPTRIRGIDLYITDDKTGVIFGNGSIGSFTLPAKTKTFELIPVDIDYTGSDVNDTTFQDLFDACGVQRSFYMPGEGKLVLNVTFHVTYHIWGIAWPIQALLPEDGLDCPSS